LAADVQLAVHHDIAAVLAQDLAAHGQPQAGAARAFAADERLEDFAELLRRDPWPVIYDDDAYPAWPVQARADANVRIRAVFHGVDGVDDDIEQGAMNPFGVRVYDR